MQLKQNFVTQMSIDMSPTYRNKKKIQSLTIATKSGFEN
jgi:hypothetical protein